MNKFLIIVVLMSVIGGSGYFYYTSTQKTISNLTKNNAVLVENNKQLETANSENIKTIDQLNENFNTVRKNYTELESQFQITRMQNDELRSRLSKHELDVLAVAKPKLVENKINEASKDAMRCFELMSGAPLNEKERNAKSAIGANSECPWLFDENFSKK